MAAGAAFDPAEFKAYKAQAGGSGQPAAPPGFDPAEFAAFKAQQTQPAFAAVGLDANVSPSTNLITVVKAKKQSKKSTKSTAPDTSGGTAATGSNATPGGK